MSFWTDKEEDALLQYLLDLKSEAGDGANFPNSVWQLEVRTLISAYTCASLARLRTSKTILNLASSSRHVCFLELSYEFPESSSLVLCFSASDTDSHRYDSVLGRSHHAR